MRAATSHPQEIMNRAFVCVAFLSVALAAPSVFGQQIRSIPELPVLSPPAETMQRVGITDMSINYSSPAAREREIWGALVPYGEVWRAGANAPTKFTSAHDFTFGGVAVPAGTYTLMIVPSESEWTFHLNTDSAGRGANAYNADEDVAVVTVPAMEGPDRERMLFLFDGTTDSSTHLTLEWAGMMAAVEVGVDTEGMARANIDAEVALSWRPAYSAARYYLESGQDLDTAAEWMGTSIAINANSWNHWFMASILAEQENYRDAREHAELAAELAAGDEVFTNFYLPRVQEALESWPRR